jgi:hypothetical protein
MPGDYACYHSVFTAIRGGRFQPYRRSQAHSEARALCGGGGADLHIVNLDFASSLTVPAPGAELTGIFFYTLRRIFT